MKQIYNVTSLVSTSNYPGTKKSELTGQPIGVILESTNASTYRTTIALTGPKVDVCAKVLDYLNDKKIYVLKGSDGIYMEISAGSTPRAAYVELTEQKWTEMPDKYEIIAADVIYTLLMSDNEEMRNMYKEVFSGDPKLMGSAIAIFCDSYYFYSKKTAREINRNARNAKDITVSDTLLIEEIHQNYRKGGLVEASFFKGIDMPETAFLKEEKVEYTGEAPVDEAPVKKSDVMEDIRNGLYKLNYEWAEDQKPYMSNGNVLKTFVPTETFTTILKKVHFRMNRVLSRMNENPNIDYIEAIGQDYINLTLVGTPGSGKTVLVHALGEATGMPVYVTISSHNTDEDEFEGKTKMVDGHPAAVPTDFLKCFKEGGICIIEEANLMQAAVAMALGQAVEYPFVLKENGYVTVKRHPLCIIITTMNTGTVGSKPMSQAFANRFKSSFLLNEPEMETFIQILANKTGESKALCRWVYTTYNGIVNCVKKNDGMADSESILLSLSMRSCIGAIENIQEGEKPKYAIENSIIGKIGETDLDLSKKCLDALKNLPDYTGKVSE